MAAGWFVVCRCGTDVYILPGASFEKSDVALNLRGQETDKFADCIFVFVGANIQFLFHLYNIFDEIQRFLRINL